jgi:dipeptidyl aminopeptidase/acylaminoacyl peptidase
MSVALALLFVTAPPKFALTVENIMRGPDLVGHAPSGPQFSLDGKTLFFRWQKAGSEQKLYAVDANGTNLREAKRSDQQKALAFDGDLTTDRTKFAYELDGDLYWYDRTKNETHRLTKTAGRESDPTWILNGEAIAYRSGDNAYDIRLADGLIEQLTDIRPSRAPEAPSDGSSAAQSAIAAEQPKLFKLFEPKPQPPRDPRTPPAVQPYTLPAGTSVRGISVSPNGQSVALSLNKDVPGKRDTIVPNYVTRSGYTEDIPGRENVGEPQDQGSVIFLVAGTGKATEITTPRPSDAYGVQWSPDGHAAVLLADSQDHKDQWLIHFDSNTLATKVLNIEHDDAWIGGPGQYTLGWLTDSKSVYFETEESGFANLYRIDTATGEKKTVVGGKFEVSDVRLSNDGQSFTFRSSEGSPYKRHLDRVSIDSGTRTKLTDLTDRDPYVYSTDEDRLCVIRSEESRPPELYVGAPTALDPVTESTSPEFESYPWINPPIVTFKARDGAEVSARIYRPKNQRPGAPAVLFVHGAGYLQNVASWWSYYYREYMFNHLLMEKGYVVLDIDYRASAGYGKAWRTGIYRHMGGKDLDDLVDGAKFLVKTFGVDSKRIGLYGGSYGGFLTLMGLFNQPDVFAAGAALRPVTDWAHYNHGYTSEILNKPQDDPEAYRQSSPIYFAQGLKGSLLICHGMIDTNVHFQDSVRLTQRLIELGKTDWEIAPYPSEDHAFTHADSWTDEYRRILKLFETTIGKKR